MNLETNSVLQRPIQLPAPAPAGGVTFDVVSGAPVELQEGDEDVYRISPNHIIDLSEPAREYWTLALPMAPLCRDDCPGLCPLCGEELSDANHACTREQVDARWAKLAGLRERL